MNTYYNEMQYAVTLENINRSTVVFHESLYRFMFQNYREDGNFLYDFSYLREALEKDGSGAKLTITEDMEETLFERRVYEGHKEKISYDPSVYETRKRGVENAEKPVIIVNGTTDVCHIAGLMECDNPNVHIFNVIGACHDEVSCAYLFTDEKVPYQPLTKAQRDEYNGVVKKALGIG